MLLLQGKHIALVSYSVTLTLNTPKVSYQSLIRGEPFVPFDEPTKSSILDCLNWRLIGEEPV